MITWMQRHKKWLIITIWIATIAFIGAGPIFALGQNSFKSSAGMVAQVGNIEISEGDFQRTYSNLYGQYNQRLNGNLDEERAEQLGLKKMALQQLIQQALILNLAKEYDLEITKEELFAEVQKTGFYNKDKAIYIQNVKSNKMTVVEFEALLTKELIIRKTIELFPVETSENEEKVVSTLLNIADKLNYKVLSHDDVTVVTSDEVLKPYWESKSQDFMNEVSYDIKFIKQAPVTKEYDEATISKYYNENRTHFKDAEGKILPLKDTTQEVVNELNAKETKAQALKTYIAYKKGKLASDVVFETATISTSNNPLTVEVLEKVANLSPTSPYMKPVLVNDTYHTIELVKVNPSNMKTYEEAKAEVLPLYITATKQAEVLKLANSSLEKFSGTTTEFITLKDADKLSKLTLQEAGEFLQRLFTSDKKRSFIILSSGKVVLYDILEQKMLDNPNNDNGNEIAKIKSALFYEGLIKTLENKYPTEIFIQGL